MKIINTKELRKLLADVLGDVSYAGEEYVVTKNNKEVAIITTAKNIEDRIDGALAKDRLERSNNKTVTLAEVIEDLGLKFEFKESEPIGNLKID